MYIHTKHFKGEQDQEVVCLITGESYVYLEGHDKTLIHPEYLEDALEALPPRFYKMPFIKRQANGHIRVFGSVD